MTIYIFTYIAIMFFGLYPYSKHNSRQSRKIFLFLSFALMTFVLGLRGITVGEDTGHYINVFNQAGYVKWRDMLHSTGMRTAYFTDEFGYTDTIENGFLVLCKVVHWFTDDAQVFLFLVAALSCTLFAKFIYDNCSDVFLATFVFMTESMFMLSFNGIRQIFAVAITLQAYTLIKNKKIKTAIFTILLAATLHNVALVALVVFPILLVKPSGEYKKFKYAIAAAFLIPFTIVVAKELVMRVFPRYVGYFFNNYWVNSLGGTTILWIVELLLIIYMYKKRFLLGDSYKLSALILIYLSFEIGGLQISIFSRVGWFFRAYLILFFSEALAFFGKRNSFCVRFMLMLMLTLLYLSYAATPARQYVFF